MTVSTLGVLTVRKYSSLVPATRPLKALELAILPATGHLQLVFFLPWIFFFSVLDRNMNLARPSTLGKFSTTALHFPAHSIGRTCRFYLCDYLIDNFIQILRQETLLVLLSIMFMSSAVSWRSRNTKWSTRAAEGRQKHAKCFPVGKGRLQTSRMSSKSNWLKVLHE